MRMPGTWSSNIRVSTDSRKKFVAELQLNNSTTFENGGKSFNISPEITYKPTNNLVLSVSPSYMKSFDELQYVDQTSYGSQDRYIFASIDQKVLSMSLRVNLNLSPDLTLQYWGQPFIASGKYYDFKYINNEMASDYHDRFVTYTPAQIKLVNDEYYSIDENADLTPDYTFDKPDFNVQEFLSNMVIRWEYNPGSSVYLVWSQTRSGFNSSGIMDFSNDMGDLFKERPHNVFLVKFSYRFGLR